VGQWSIVVDIHHIFSVIFILSWEFFPTLLPLEWRLCDTREQPGRDGKDGLPGNGQGQPTSLWLVSVFSVMEKRFDSDFNAVFASVRFSSRWISVVRLIFLHNFSI
jgi:hypothetical protein